MDFALNEQQEMMQTLARDFLAGEFPDKVLRATVKDETGFAPELWQKMAATNLLGLSVPEAYGGVGDFLDLAVVLEEMGKVCFISPFFTAVTLGAGIIMAAGSEAQQKQYLPAVAEGKAIVTLALAESTAKYTEDEVQLKAVAQGGDYVLNGVKMFVPYARVADNIVCAARTDGGVTLFLVEKDAPGIAVSPLPVISGEKNYEVTFTDVKVSAEDILGEVGDGWRHVEKVLQKANAALCAEMVGLAGQALKITLDYAKERVAFGHPIGAFQSIQHRCADMLIDVEGARYVTYQAAWLINEGLPATREAAIAKAWVGRACRRVMHSAHQVHGAIGFTEDHILHFYTRKAEADMSALGGVDAQLEKI